MTETTDIAVIEIKPDQAPALYVPNGLDAYLEIIRQQVNEVPDLSTTKGRTRVASLAAQVSRSKTAIEKPGREYLKRLKEAVKPAEVEIKRFVDACDELRDATRQPLTEWEAEQDRLKAVAEMEAWHEEALTLNADFDKALAERFEADYEVALLMNDKFDRDAADAKAEAERKRIAYEQELQQQAADKAKREVAEAARLELEAAAQREAALKASAEKAENDRIEADQRAEREKKETAERVEREKNEAIAAEQLKAKQEADRIKLEAEQKEASRLAEEKRVADEAAARAANEAHRKSVGTAVVNALMANAGLTRVQSIDVLMQIKDGNIPHTSITY
ncbi:coiled-coil domain-containing protein [Winslowiella arboricola]|uniref:hypothetical protein n=1 Tax=Winslowiella arboricola TaxID=2978220 RepID=UPI00225DE6AB|nr:hypothetical protein [Winslowiella arboricola]MCU5775077.1 hypothetical protein [Winslowiella arboricola]